MRHSKLLIALAMLFSMLTRNQEVFAADYYTYCDPDGKLVISNKKPPEGSKIIKKQHLPDNPKEEATMTSDGAAAKIESGEPSKNAGPSPQCNERPQRKSIRTSMVA